MSLAPALVGAVLNYAAVVGVVAWSGTVIDRIVAASGGAGSVWVSPKVSDYEHQALGVPGNVGIGCVLLVTALVTYLLVRRRARVWVVIAFALLNLFALVVLTVLLDLGAVEHGLYP